MKLTFKYWLIAFLSAVFLAAAIWAVAPAIIASADTGDITCTTASGNYLNEDYLSVYKVPTSIMTYEANGGEASGKPLSNAFDGNWNTFWATGKENAGQGMVTPTFANAITVTFSQPVTIQSIVYASSSERLGHGYPVTLNVYTANNGELSLYGTCNSDATNDRVVFTLNEAVTVTQIKFEFRKVNTMHNWTATAKEICFLQPDNPSANKVLDLFDDYSQYEVKDEYKNQLSEIRGNVSSLVSYESALKPLLDRAQAIVDGTLTKDSRREFSTDPNAANVITQYGNLRAYAGNTLKMSQFGINRQVMGIAGLTNQTITIYVEANAGDPLPSVVFTQAYGYWSNWYSRYNLSLGKNVFTFPNFINSDYSQSVVAGGPIHIENAYEPSQQSSNVKVYIEGGYSYPVFRKGGDEASFREELTSYYNNMNTEGLNDVVELVGDHFIHTATASKAYNDFITRQVSPQKNAESWDNYLTAFLEFDGISMNPADAHYNEKNLHLYNNFRKVQPWSWAGAYSFGEHIGFIQFGEDSMTRFGTPGWGVAHEIGHSMDCTPREISETTNNMWSKFELAYFSNSVSRNQNDWITNNLTSDETALDFNLFNKNREVYQIWWNLEACHHGYWGNLDNTYRYYDEAAAKTKAGVTSADGQLTQTERMIYFSSLAIGEDLGYYFERCSFSFDSTPFRLETATGAYEKLVAQALKDGVIEEKGVKYWYVDANQYFYEHTGNDYYDSSSRVEIDSAKKTDAGYVLYLNVPDGTNAHLGYEIMEYRDGNWYVIGFTNTNRFTDSTAYPDGYVPQYKIRGYDREMSASAESAPASFEELAQVNVCRIGNVYYDSLSAAVAAANANDTIYICADLYDANITVNKNLTLLPDPSLTKSVVIKKEVAGILINVNGGAILTIGSTNGATIVFDGKKFSQNGTLIKVNSNGILRITNAELCNNINTDHGGALFVNGNGAVAECTNVTFKNNSVTGNDRNGGAIANFSGNVTLTDCYFIGNSTNTNGGAITVDGKLTLIRCIIKGNSAKDKGGAMFIACNGNDRTVTVDGGEISGNTAKNSGSAIYLGRGIFTLVGGEEAVKISGEIFRGEAAVRIENALPDFSDVIFKGSFTKQGTVLLTAIGDLTFTEEFVASLNVAFADLYIEGNGQTVLAKAWPTVSFDLNGTVINQQVKPGNFVLLDEVEGFDETKYVISWEFNGNSYSAGETVEITDDCTITATSFGNKYTVTLKYSENETHTVYVKPNGDFVLEECSAPEGKVFSHWVIDGVAYKAGDTVRITGNTVITAVFGEPSDSAPQTPSDNNGNNSNAWTIVVVVIIVFFIAAGAIIAAVLIIKYKDAAEE